IGNAVAIPGWTNELFRSATIDIFGAGILTILLLPFVAFIASIGRGFMAAFGWAIFTVAIAQVAVVMGWGDWLPWSVPALFSGAIGAHSETLGMHSYLIVAIASAVGFFITFYWWRNADQAK
ncbi:MAG TPA: hypothetical protein PKM54_14050, partial [Anaerolineales bacterium]|nr:hypothetical protein [Anaerolineales bacterium]